MTTIYLAGPINGCGDGEANDWREYVTERWAGDVLNPMRRDYRGTGPAADNIIVTNDKTDIDNADIVIAYSPRPSYGTAMEILYAWTTNTPVIAVVPEGPTSPWVRYHATTVVHTLDDAIAKVAA